MTAWKKTEKVENAEGTTITYTKGACRLLKIESRKRHIPHANGIGTWDHTSYFVITQDGKEIECWKLADAISRADAMLPILEANA